MMRWIVGWSIRFRRLVAAAAAGLIIFAAVVFDDARTDTLPEFGETTVEVQTEALGLSAEEVEQFITVPLEQDLLNGVAFLQDIESVSLPGLSSVIMTFEPGTDMLDARQVVAERLTQAVGVAGLPHVAELPQMMQPLSSTSRVSLVKLSSDSFDPIDLSILARWRIVPALLGVEGVANVSVWGFRDKQLQVLVDPARLSRLGVTLHDVIRTAGNALEVSTLSYLEASSPGTGGWVEMPNQRLHIFHRQAITTADELGEVPIEADRGAAPTSGGEPVTLGEATDVVEDHQPLIGDTVCTDGECLLLVVERFPDANTVEVTRGVEATLETLAPGLPGVEIDTSIYRPAAHVEEGTGNVARALTIGGLLLLVVFALMLPSWRSFAIAAAAVASSLAVAWVALDLTDTTIDMMLAAGLVAGVLVVIHEAVEDADELGRRMRAARDEASGVPSWGVLMDAALETRGAMLYATFIVAVATVPLFAMQGESGAFLPRTAAGFLLAIVAAMLAALTVTPALAMLIGGGDAATRVPIGIRMARSARARVSGTNVGRPLTSLVVAGGLVVAGLAMLPFLDADTQPSLRERDLRVELTSEPGTSLPAMNNLTADAVEALRNVPGVDAVAGYVGRAIASDERTNVNAAQVWLRLAEDADYEDSIASVRSVVDQLDASTTAVGTYTDARVEEVLTTSEDDITVRVYGEDLDVLEEKSSEIRDAVAGIDGVQGASVRTPPTESTIVVQADIEAARAAGIKPGDVRRTAATLVAGITVGNVFDEQKVFDAVVWGVPQIRETPEDVADLMIDAPGGGQVRLGDVASVDVTERPAEIRHESVASYLDVTADVSGREVDDVAVDVEAAIAGVEFPFEHHAEVLGGLSEDEAARNDLILISLAALIVAFLILQAALSSWRLATVVFAMLPLALVGGVAVVVLTEGGDMTLGAVAGLLAVFAFACRTAIMLVRSTRAALRSGDVEHSSVVEAQQRRTRATVIGAVAVIAFFAPFALTPIAPGLELLQPLARVAIGGVVTTLLVVALVLPPAVQRFGPADALDDEADLGIITIPDVESMPR